MVPLHAECVLTYLPADGFYVRMPYLMMVAIAGWMDGWVSYGGQVDPLLFLCRCSEELANLSRPNIFFVFILHNLLFCCGMNWNIVLDVDGGANYIIAVGLWK